MTQEMSDDPVMVEDAIMEKISVSVWQASDKG